MIHPDSLEGLEHLQTALSLTEGFAFYLLILSGSRLLEEVLIVLGLNQRPIRLELPVTSSTVQQQKEAIDRFFIALSEAVTQNVPVIVDASLSWPEAQNCWQEIFRRLNEWRNDVARRLHMPFLLALSPSLEADFAHNAPDFWNIQTLTIRVIAKLEPQDTPIVQRMEAAVTPWLADPAQAQIEVEKARPAGGPLLAAALRRSSQSLASVMRWTEAVQAATEATALYRNLAATRPDNFLPDLAHSLNNLGTILSNLGDREGAFSAIREAVDIWQHLIDASPDAFLPDLAISLSNLGPILFNLGDREGALSATHEAVDIWQHLTTTSPDAFLPDLAISLSNLGADLSTIGDQEKALSTTREAVDIQRRLAVTQPDAFLPNLAMSLNNLGIILSKLGDQEGALSATQEAVDIQRRLAATRPDVFLPNLAIFLVNLGIRLSALGSLNDALNTVIESIQIWNRLVPRHPHTFLPDALKSVGQYLQLCERIHSEVDQKLLAPIETARQAQQH